MTVLTEKTVLYHKRKKDVYHSSQISNAITFPFIYGLCILIVRPNICAYKHSYVTDLHKQIGTVCFLSLSLAGMVPEWKGYWLIPQTSYSPKHQWDYLKKPKKEPDRSQDIKARNDYQIQFFPAPFCKLPRYKQKFWMICPSSFG